MARRDEKSLKRDFKLRGPWESRYLDDDVVDEDDWSTYIHRNLAHLAGQDSPYPGSHWSYARHDASFDTADDHRGKGPKGWTRSDERIREDASEALYHSNKVDASEIVVDVSNGVISLSGFVDSRFAKKEAERIVENVPGVWDVHNQLHIAEQKKKGSLLGGT